MDTKSRSEAATAGDTGNGCPYRDPDSGGPLDDGRRLYFLVEETETGEYGVTLCLTDKPRR